MRKLELLLAAALLVIGLGTALTASADGGLLPMLGVTVFAVSLTALALHLMHYGLASVLDDFGLRGLARRLGGNGG